MVRSWLYIHTCMHTWRGLKMGLEWGIAGVRGIEVWIGMDWLLARA